MSGSLFLAAMAMGILLSPSTFPGSTQDTKADDKAKAVFGSFVKAIKSKDLNGMMKLNAVPWLDSSQKIIRNEKELKEMFKGFLDEGKEASFVNSAIKEVVSYSRFRKKFGDNEDNKQFLKMLDELKLMKDDRVIVQADTAILIQIRDGKAKIIGILE